MENPIPGYYSGTSGLLLPVKNKLFYPEEFKDKSRLCFYSSLLNSLEVNSSFYKVPMASTVKKWTEEVSPGFKFTFKLSRDITHNQGLAFDPNVLKRFLEVIEGAGEKKGALLVQFPASIRITNLRQINLLMHCLRAADPNGTWDIAMEFRHASLYNDVVYQLLDTLKIGLVLQDMPLAVTPMLDNNLPFVYVRFHGPGGSYAGSYEDDLLYEYAGYIRDWLVEGKTVYVYFNNTMGAALANRNTLQEMVAALLPLV